MKRAGVISTAILFLLLGTTASAFAQHEEKGREQGKSQAGQQHQQPAQQRTRSNSISSLRSNRISNRLKNLCNIRQSRNRAMAAPITAASRPTALLMGASTIAASHNTLGRCAAVSSNRAPFVEYRPPQLEQRGGYNGYRIPDERFRAYFGRDHFFRISGLPLVFVGGYPRFQYDGYWVTFVDPWPDTWPANWYETDDVYLDYTDDGYYLYDRERPGPGIAVTIAF